MNLPSSHRSPLTIRSLRASTDPAFDALARVYTDCLPESERKSISALRTMVDRPEYVFLAALCGTAVVGFSIAIGLAGSDAALLEYLGVDAAHRGRGIGQALFRATASQQQIAGRYLLLEVESDKLPSTDAQERQRRKAFYRRSGCMEIDGLTYIMPSVSTVEPPLMDMLVYGRELPCCIDKPRLQSWLQGCYSQVYGRPCDDSAIEDMLRDVGEKITLR